MSDLNNLPNHDFQRIRDGLKVPREFPANVLAEAEAAADQVPQGAAYKDFLAAPFVTIDPPGSRDLDQALFLERSGDGYVVRYAIADVGFFVKYGSDIEREAWRRGQTLYSPDLKTPLYPPALCENGASLLPDVLRPAIVFSLTLDSRAQVQAQEISRALVRSLAQLAYPEVQQHLSQERAQAGSGALAGREWSASLSLLEEVGRKRQTLEAERGGVSLRIPSQQVERWTTAVSGYRLAFETSSEVEDWNAQISLMTGIVAAQTMIAHQIGLLRSLAPPRPDRVQALRLMATALKVSWPAEMAYSDFVRSLDPVNPLHAVMLHQAARVTGGARYTAFEGSPPPHALHAGIASFYAHATAPLRRLADRYVLDLLVALSSNDSLDSTLLAALPELPKVMSDSDAISRRLESQILDYVEAWLLRDRIGETFAATVIALRADGVVVQITDPPIRTLISAKVFARASQAKDSPTVSLSSDGAALQIGDVQITLGQSLNLKLEATDPVTGSLSFSPSAMP